MSNCTVDDNLTPWVIASVIQNFVVCVLGAIGNACSLWCLWRCTRTRRAIKLQLLCLFALLLTWSLLTQPVVTYIFYKDYFCLDTSISSEAKFVFSSFNSVVMQLERASFTSIAVIRMVAVYWPERYKRWSSVCAVVWVQVGLLIYVVPSWLIFGALQGFRMPPGGTVMLMMAGRRGSILFTFNTVIYVLYYVLPFVVTLVSYGALMVRLKLKKHLVAGGTDSPMDQVFYTVRLLLTFNLVFDFTHVILHMSPYNPIASMGIHMIFFLHFILDPAIFVGLNPRYRREIWRQLGKYLPLAPAPPSSTQSGHQVDSLEVRATYHHTQQRGGVGISSSEESRF